MKKKLIKGFLMLSLAVFSTETLMGMTIQLSHNQPENSSEHDGAVEFKRRVEELSGGKMNVDIFPAMQLGSMREQAESVQMGTLEMSIQPISVLTPFVEEFQLVDFPFVWPNSDVMWKVLDGEAGDKILEKAEPKNFQGLGFWGAGFKHFTVNGKEIKAAGDFKGVKMRVMPSPLLLAQYKTWGANAVPIEYAELYNALQQKIVDGQENPISTIAMNKYYEVQNNLVLSEHGYLAYVVIANKEWFDSLSKDEQEIIKQAESDARKVQRASLEQRETKFLEEIKGSKINITSLTDGEKEGFRKASEPVYEQFTNTPAKKELFKTMVENIQKVRGM